MKENDDGDAGVRMLASIFKLDKKIRYFSFVAGRPVAAGAKKIRVFLFLFLVFCSSQDLYSICPFLEKHSKRKQAIFFKIFLP